MDAKDLRTDTAPGERNDGSKYSQSGVALQCNRNKSYQDIGSNPFSKTEPTVRPCAVIGPGVPPPAPCDAYLKKGPFELWPYPDNTYPRPPEYPHKLQNNVNPIRNISPRQTFQENMQRILVPPTYSAVKHIDESSSSHVQDQSATLPKHAKQTIPSEAKYCDVPYSVNLLTNEHKTREPEICVPSVNSPLTLTPPNGWPPSSNIHPMRTYGAHDIYQYPQYPSCAGPRPPVMPMGRPHRTFQEEAGYVYPDSYYQDASVRFKPYPPVKERYPQSRYEYIGNYSNPFHPLPYAPNKYDIPNTRTPHPYPGYPQLKYVDNRVPDSNIEGYQLPNQHNINHNMQFRNQVIHPSYTPTLGSMQNKVLCYTPNISGKPANKSAFDNKTHVEYENAKGKYPDNYVVNEVARVHQAKNTALPNYASPSLNAVPMPQYHRKSYEYMTHYRHFEQPIGFNSLGHHPTPFSPNTLAISPTDSNTSNDTTHGTSQEDCGYVSQSSTTSVRSIDSANRLSNDFYRRYDYRYRPTIGNSSMLPKAEAKTKENKNIDVRQFLSMWSEDQDNTANTKEITTLRTKRNEIAAKNQDQLYVLGLVNVPNEELAKYEHIQKISKLPDNIKGYNSIELLNQFEEVIESSNLNSARSSGKEYNNAIKDRKNIMKPIVEVLPRPISPLDVEAKISQSVIHKDVGCNFEIKPCSPKMMSAERAAPVQYLGERVIEKVSNPLSNKPKSPLSIRVDIGNTQSIQRPESTPHSIYESPSCKMVGSPFTTSNIESAKTDYSLQDLETSSGVCLASLPRLDNEIELNFPEVNQQFINANKADHSLIPEQTQEAVNNNLESELFKNEGSDISEKNTTLSKDIPIVVTRLSKYRKTKTNILENSEDESILNAARTDSVIIENPENVRKTEDNSFNRIMKEGQESKPVNLTSQCNSNLDIQHVEPHSDVEYALDFSLSKPDNGLPIISNKYHEYITQPNPTHDNNEPVVECVLNGNNHAFIDTKKTLSAESLLCETNTKSIIVRNECDRKIKEESTFSGAKPIDPLYSRKKFITPALNEHVSDFIDDNADRTTIEIKINTDEIHSEQKHSPAKVIVEPKNKSDTRKNPSHHLTTDIVSEVRHDNIYQDKYLPKHESPTRDNILRNDISSERLKNTDTEHSFIIPQRNSVVLGQNLDINVISESDSTKEKKHELLNVNSVVDVESETIQENNIDFESVSKIQKNIILKDTSLILDQTNKYDNNELISENKISIDKNISKDTGGLQSNTNSLLLREEKQSIDVLHKSNDLPVLTDTVRKPDPIITLENESIIRGEIVNNDVVNKPIMSAVCIARISHTIENNINDQIPECNAVLETNKVSTSLSETCHNLLGDKTCTLNKNIAPEIESVVDSNTAALVKVANDSTTKDQSDVKSVDDRVTVEISAEQTDEPEIKSVYDTATASLVKLANDSTTIDESEMKSVVDTLTSNLVEESANQNYEPDIKSVVDIVTTSLVKVKNGSIKNIETEMKSVVDIVTTANLIDESGDQKCLINKTKSDESDDKHTTCIDSDAADVHIKSITDSTSPNTLVSSNNLFERAHSMESGYHLNKTSLVGPENYKDVLLTISEKVKEDINFNHIKQQKTISNKCDTDNNDIKPNNKGPMLNIDILKTPYLSIDIGKLPVIEQIVNTNNYEGMNPLFEKTLEEKLDNTEVGNINKATPSVTLNNGSYTDKSEINGSDIKVPIKCEISFENVSSSVARFEKSNENSELETLGIEEVQPRSLKEHHEVPEGLRVKRFYHSGKELYSPWIQKLSIHTEGKYSETNNTGYDIFKTKLRNKDNKIIAKAPKEAYTYSDKCVKICEKELAARTGLKSDIECDIILSEVKTKSCKSESSLHSGIDACQNSSDQPENNIDKNISCSPIDQETIPEIENSCIVDEECDVQKVIDTEEISFRYSNNSIISQISKHILQKDSSFEFNSVENRNGRFDDPPPINHFQRLKRSFSDSSLNTRMDRDEDNINNLWPPKRNKVSKYENVLPNNRRNSVNIEENISFCILIDDNCLITEDNEEKICIAELPEDYITEIDTVIDENNTDAIVELDTSSLDEHMDEGEPAVAECVDEDPLQTWVEDIACTETVFDDVAENVIISAPSSPTESASEYDYDDSYNSRSCNEINYEESRSDVQPQLEDTIYNTPEREMNKTLLFGQEISEYQDNSDCEGDIQLELCEDWKPSLKNTPDYIDQTETSNDFSLETPENKENVFVKELSPLRRIDDYLDMSSAENETEQQEEHCQPQIHLGSSNIRQQYEPVCFDESYLDSAVDYKTKDESSTSSSSSEVSSTTSEENKSILLKITNINGSKVSLINEIEPNKRPRCKFTEKLDYAASDLNFPNRPLITKAAQKYIPPIKDSIKELKVQIKLPQQRLLKLKQLKMSKTEPKVQKQSNVVLRVPKKVKPNFDDVLKSIDEVQIKMHKEKSKRVKSIVPKVLIKKNQNGSHYASTPKRDTFNPDLTGRKWQPWVFLEKNRFIDKMAIRNKTRAIFSHRKQTYVLAEKFKKYKSANTKFIISQPKNIESSGKLKYTIRLKHIN